MTATLGVGIAGRQAPPQNPPPSPPQTPPTQEPQRPVFRAKTNFVRVDVYPTVDGKPVEDLTAGDFEVYEDEVLQTLETFERVKIQAGGAPITRVEPRSPTEANQMAADPRVRLIVLFLDTHHAQIASSMQIRSALVNLIQRLVAQDDLVAVMTPGMSAADVTFTRRTDQLQDMLAGNPFWGERDGLIVDDPVEQLYEMCYPSADPTRVRSGIAEEMINRRREARTLDALDDLVVHLEGIREERKAILLISEGYLLYRPSRELADAGGQPRRPGVFVGPDGRLGTTDRRNAPYGEDLTKCDSDRIMLANLDNDRRFRDLTNVANRANSTFYPVEPRGLVAFDTDIGTITPPPMGEDVDVWLRERVETAAATLRARHDALEVLALNTDGFAIVNSNDIDAGLRRVVDDLSSYYLLGYTSTNAKLDGQFRRIAVKVARPGVAVRARRGYRAATEAEVAAGRAAVEPPEPAAEAVEAALGTLTRIRPDTPFRLRVVPGAGGVWVAGEVEAAAVRARGFAGGGTAEILASGGRASGTIRVSLGPGERAFLTWLDVSNVGDWVDVQARLAPADRSARPLTDAVRADTRDGAREPLLFRRGPATGNRVQPAADSRFSRAERVRLEWPVGPGVEPGQGRVLDQKGQPLVPPVEVGVRTDEATGQRWVTADVTLAPLGQGDYVIEVTVVDASATERILTAIRVTR